MKKNDLPNLFRAKPIVTSEKGSAILEFTLILPLLILVVLGTVEYSQIFKIREFQTTVVREANSIIYRNCFQQGTRNCEIEPTGILGGNGASTDLEACLNFYSTAISENLTRLFPDAVLSVSFYEYSSVNDTISNLAISTRYGDETLNATRSEYWLNGRKQDAVLRPSIEEHGVMVVVEIYITYPFSLIDVLAPTLELYHVGIV